MKHHEILCVVDKHQAFLVTKSQPLPGFRGDLAGPGPARCGELG